MKFEFKKYVAQILIVIFFIIGMLTCHQYGISSDEKLEILMVDWNYDLVVNNNPIPMDLKHYGTVFNVTAELIYQVTERFRLNFSVDSDQLASDSFLRRITVKHYATFLVSLITYAAVAGLLRFFVDVKYIWLAPLTLALFPRFWGHSFFNPKDIPFAAVFTLATFAGGLLIRFYLSLKREQTYIGVNRTSLYTLIFGFLVGLLTGVRIGGLFLLFFVFFSHLAVSFFSVGFLSFIRRYFCLYALMIFSWFCTTVAVYPASWSNPFLWLWETLLYLSNHGWSGTVLFEGTFIKADSLPWYYLPKWFFLSTPIVFQVLFFIGFIILLFKFFRFYATQKAVSLLLLFQIVFFPLIAILKGSTVYDGLRQFLFVLPPVACLTAFAMVWLYTYLKKMTQYASVLVTAALLVVSSPVVFDMITLHPYQYVYFNRLGGGLASAKGKYETDYWGLSMREGMEWINNTTKSEARVVASTQLSSASPFADHNVEVISYENFKKHGIVTPFYYIARPRWNFQEKFSKCESVYSVIRHDVPLTIVKKCVK